MLKALRQHVTVGPDGVVQIQDRELPQGSCVEVIVLVEQPPAPDAAGIAARLEAFDRVRKELNLTPESAAKWMQEIREEREAVTDRVLRRDSGRAKPED